MFIKTINSSSMLKHTVSFQSICQAFHSELVVINDAEENSLIRWSPISKVESGVETVLFCTIVIAVKQELHSNKTCQNKHNAFYINNKYSKDENFLSFYIFSYLCLNRNSNFCPFLYRCIFFELLDGWFWSNHRGAVGLGINDGNNKIHKLETRWTEQLRRGRRGLSGALSVWFHMERYWM